MGWGVVGVGMGVEAQALTICIFRHICMQLQMRARIIQPICAPAYTHTLACTCPATKQKAAIRRRLRFQQAVLRKETSKRKVVVEIQSLKRELLQLEERRVALVFVSPALDRGQRVTARTRHRFE